MRSHKTIYSTNGATISRGSLRIGKASLGAQRNIIIKNLKFTDLWVFDPSGNYDGYGWDYVHLEESSHHVWVDHCDFDQVYDGMIDVAHAGDYVTVSWNVLRNQKKCRLIGHSDSNAAEDTGQTHSSRCLTSGSNGISKARATSGSPFVLKTVRPSSSGKRGGV